MSKIRGLAVKQPVNGKLIPRGEIRRYVEKLLDAQTPKDAIESSEALLIGLGVVPVSFRYRETVLELMEQQLLGFYDPKDKAFFVGGDLAGREAEVTLWHELVHALQDQHYDLLPLTEWKPDLGDSQAAIHSLAEGDATSAMLDGVMSRQGGTALDLPEGAMRAEGILGAASGSAPPVLVRSLVAPYVDGLVFTHFLRRRGGGDFAAVDEAWRAPPTSTEQLLHPEKYLAGEPPIVVPIPAGPPHAPDLQERFHDVVGEQALRVVLEEWMPAKTAAGAASDWGGDRIAVFSDEPRKTWAVGWRIRYDKARAAQRGLVALARGVLFTEAMAARSGDLYVTEEGARRAISSDQICQDRPSRGAFALVRRGTDLAVAVGPFRRDEEMHPGLRGCREALAWAHRILTSR
jgi:hypothetical protein